MKIIAKVSFAEMTPEQRIKVATKGLSISDFANGRSKPISPKQSEEVERIAIKTFVEFSRNSKLEPA